MHSAAAAAALGALRVNPDRVRIVDIPDKIVRKPRLLIAHTLITHNWSSCSCCSAFLATVWNACSTLIASFADVSK